MNPSKYFRLYYFMDSKAPEAAKYEPANYRMVRIKSSNMMNALSKFYDKHPDLEPEQISLYDSSDEEIIE